MDRILDLAKPARSFWANPGFEWISIYVQATRLLSSFNDFGS
jgi:hypothetical protein